MLPTASLKTKKKTPKDSWIFSDSILQLPYGFVPFLFECRWWCWDRQNLGIAGREILSKTIITSAGHTWTLSHATGVCFFRLHFDFFPLGLCHFYMGSAMTNGAVRKGYQLDSSSDPNKWIAYLSQSTSWTACFCETPVRVQTGSYLLRTCRLRRKRKNEPSLPCQLLFSINGGRVVYLSGEMLNIIMMF